MTGFNAGAWQSADPNAEQEDNDPPVPGTYDVVVSDARAFTSSKGNDVLILNWTITTGPQTGYSWSDVRGFKTEGAIKAAKALCTSLGVDVDGIGALEDLDAAVKQQLGEYFRVEVAQNGSYRNVYIKGKPEGTPVSDVPGEFPAAAAAAAAADEEPAPF